MFEAWSVSIRLRLIDSATMGVLGLSKRLLEAHGSATKLQERMEKIGRQLAIGGAVAGAGAGIFGMIGKTIPAATKYADELSRLNTLGLNSAEIARATKSAWETTYAVPTTTVWENLAAFRELSSVLGDRNRMEGIQLLPDVGKLEGVMFGLTGKHQEHVGFDLVKATELRAPGGVNVETLKRNADLMARTMVAFQGTLGVSDFHAAFKMGKTGTQAWSDDFAYKYLPTLMQELKTGNGGAQSAGTYLETFSRQVHGRIQKSAIPLWEAAGLINSRDVVKNKTGQFQLKPGAVKDVALAETNPFEWVIKDLKPAAEKLMRERHLTLKSAIDGMFTDRNGAFVAYTMINKQQQFERDKNMVENRSGLDVYKQMLKTNPSMAAYALHQQWEGIMATIGYTIMPDLLAAANALMPALREFTGWMQKNPGAVKGMVAGLSGLASVLTIAGGITITAAAVRAFKLFFEVIGKSVALGSKLLGFVPKGAAAAEAATGVAAAAEGAGAAATVAEVGVAGTAAVAVAKRLKFIPTAAPAAEGAAAVEGGGLAGAALTGATGLAAARKTGLFRNLGIAGGTLALVSNVPTDALGNNQRVDRELQAFLPGFLKGLIRPQTDAELEKRYAHGSRTDRMFWNAHVAALRQESEQRAIAGRTSPGQNGSAPNAAGPIAPGLPTSGLAKAFSDLVAATNLLNVAETALLRTIGVPSPPSLPKLPQTPRVSTPLAPPKLHAPPSPAVHIVKPVPVPAAVHIVRPPPVPPAAHVAVGASASPAAVHQHVHHHHLVGGRRAAPAIVPRLPKVAVAAVARLPVGRGKVTPATLPNAALVSQVNAAMAGSVKAFGDLTAAAGALQRAQLGLSRATTDFATQVVRAMQKVRMVQVTATTNLDGRKLAETVTTHQAHAMTGPRATARPDTRAALMPAAAGYSY